ncbi:hypothetical protein D3C72_2178790 [compost metagenome]
MRMAGQAAGAAAAGAVSAAWAGMARLAPAARVVNANSWARVLDMKGTMVERKKTILCQTPRVRTRRTTTAMA